MLSPPPPSIFSPSSSLGRSFRPLEVIAWPAIHTHRSCRLMLLPFLVSTLLGSALLHISVQKSRRPPSHTTSTLSRNPTFFFSFAVVCRRWCWNDAAFRTRPITQHRRQPQPTLNLSTASIPAKSPTHRCWLPWITSDRRLPMHRRPLPSAHHKTSTWRPHHPAIRLRHCYHLQVIVVSLKRLQLARSCMLHRRHPSCPTITTLSRCSPFLARGSRSPMLPPWPPRRLQGLIPDFSTA